jgi:hypothetical protein
MLAWALLEREGRPMTPHAWVDTATHQQIDP